FRYGIDARYAGQGNEITIWVGEGDTWPAAAERVQEAFDAEYRRIYGLTIPDVAIEAVTWRLSASAATNTVEPNRTLDPADGAPTPIGHRPMRFDRGQDPIDAPVFRRGDLGVGARFDGPAVVEERETTSVIRPGWSVEVAADGSLVATPHAAPERAFTLPKPTRPTPTKRAIAAYTPSSGTTQH